MISAGLSFVSEGWLDLVWDVWGDLALLYMSLILLLRFPDNAGMPFVLAMTEVRNKQKHAGFLKSRLSTGTLVSFISFCWPKKSHVQDQIQEMTKQICRLNERNYKVTGQRPRYKE